MIRRKKKSQEEIQKNNEEREGMWNFFLEIWNERKHYCEVTGKWLGNTPKTYMFDHLIEKSAYPELKYEKDNIILCDGDIHSQKTMGNPHPKHQELIDNAKKKFNIL